MKFSLFFALSIIPQFIWSQITDINGQSYKTVVIGSQTWFAENLNVDRFRNGDPIPEAKTDAEWEQAGENKQPAWCYYNNDPANGTKYGKLYNWYAVNDPRGLALEGWHVPSVADWTILIDYLGSFGSGIKMKSSHDWGFEGNGTNVSGFSGLPGGYRIHTGVFKWEKDFVGHWWSSTEHNKYGVPLNSIESNRQAYYRKLSNYSDHLLSGYDFMSEGFSVRCIKD
jgi:uncharacterized protein (TIGR02145 family)